jgi:hypothetical protein
MTMRKRSKTNANSGDNEPLSDATRTIIKSEGSSGGDGTPVGFLQAREPFLVGKENKAVKVLRAAVLVLLVTMATIVCVGVYLLTRGDELKIFEQEYEDNAFRLVESFHDDLERKLGAIDSFANQITSYALDTNRTFPFVTLPNFAIRGSKMRIQADAFVFHWAPLVTDGERIAWEEYAMQNRFHIDEAFEEDEAFRLSQDEEFGLLGDEGKRLLLDESPLTETIVDDGTGYHSKIWSAGSLTPRGDEPQGSGPYLPLWQRR